MFKGNRGNQQPNSSVTSKQNRHSRSRQTKEHISETILTTWNQDYEFIVNAAEQSDYNQIERTENDNTVTEKNQTKETPGATGTDTVADIHDNYSHLDDPEKGIQSNNIYSHLNQQHNITKDYLVGHTDFYTKVDDEISTTCIENCDYRIEAKVDSNYDEIEIPETYNTLENTQTDKTKYACKLEPKACINGAYSSLSYQDAARHSQTDAIYSHLKKQGIVLEDQILDDSNYSYLKCGEKKPAHVVLSENNYSHLNQEQIITQDNILENNYSYLSSGTDNLLKKRKPNTNDNYSHTNMTGDVYNVLSETKDPETARDYNHLKFGLKQ